MNLLDKKIGLLALVALLFFSCDDEVGELTIAPENNLGVFFAEIPLGDRVRQVWEGSVPSTFSGISIAGSYQDSVFGVIEATSFLDISVRLPVSYDPETISSAELIDLELDLRVVNAVGNFSESDNQTLSLYKLTSPVDEDADFSTALEIGLGEKVGEAQFNIFADSIGLAINSDIDSSEFDRYDVNGIYRYITTFTFTDSYKAEFLDGFRRAVIDGAVNENEENDIDSVNFFLDQNLNGLAMVSEEANTAIVSYNIEDTPNYTFRLNYTTLDSEGNQVDQNADFQFNRGKSFNNITPNENFAWNGGVFDGLSEINSSTNLTSDYGYLLSGANMHLSIDMSDITQRFDTIPNVIISRAFLSLNGINSMSTTNSIPANVGVQISNLNGISEGDLSQVTGATVLSDLPNVGIYDTLNNQYQMDVTLYFQGLVDNNILSDQIIIALGSDNNFQNFFVEKDSVQLDFFYTQTE